LSRSAGSAAKNYGTAAANLLEAEIVTADGTVHIANACSNADLFWALKGGGGGTPRIAAIFRLRLHDDPGVVRRRLPPADRAVSRLLRGEDIFGDGVNVAARLEGLAEPGGVLVSNTVYEHARDRLPFAFEDLGEHQVKNIARPVRVYRVRDRAISADEAAVGPAQPLPLPDKPSIAVLPFANMSGDPEQEYFADGMVEEIITALSRIRWLFVIARNSSFTYKGQAVDVKRIGQELGVRYVLEGSVRKAGSRVRITAQLIDAASGAHLWADRFDGPLEDVFDVQDEVASRVAGVIEPTLQAAETARSAHRPTNDLTAYDLYLRAYAMFWLPARHIPEVLRLAEQAIARDPHYGPALALAAVCCFRLVLDGRSQDPEANLRTRGKT
jgi:adenylate cyclase